MADDADRSRLDLWALREGADEPSRLIFLSLDHELRDQVRGMGKLSNARNPSSLLISRIRSVCNDYVVLDTEAQIVWDSNAAQRMRDYGIHNTEKRIIILVIRGETHRTGRNKQHRTAGLIEEFILNLKSIFCSDPFAPPCAIVTHKLFNAASEFVRTRPFLSIPLRCGWQSIF